MFGLRQTYKKELLDCELREVDLVPMQPNMGDLQENSDKWIF